MKLLFCIDCNTIFNLSRTYTECKCGKGGGHYVNSLDAKVFGDPKKVFVLGFANSSFERAIVSQAISGDSTEMMPYAGKMTPKGRDFTAFVIPDAADSIIRVDSKDKM